jgi:hypothetical protein
MTTSAGRMIGDGDTIQINNKETIMGIENNHTTIGIYAKVILDSLIDGKRVTTLELNMPRFILAQFNTHRVFSRNSASSRYISAKRRRAMMNFNFQFWFTDAKPGGLTTVLSGWRKTLANVVWKFAKYSMKLSSWALSSLGVSREQSNRLIELFLYNKTLVTSTEWENFFKQRLDFHTQYEMQVLATEIKSAMRHSKPVVRAAHLPYVDNDTVETDDTLVALIKMSVGRSARVSSETVGLPGSDMALYDRLEQADPFHASAFEHAVFSPKFYSRFVRKLFDGPRQSDNLNGNLEKGLVQFRKVIESKKSNEKAKS